MTVGALMDGSDSQMRREQRSLARQDRLQARTKRALRSLPLLLWGALYACVGLLAVGLGLAGWLAGWSPFGFGPDSPLTPWSEIALNGLIPLCLGCVIMVAAVVLTGAHEHRATWKVLLGISGVITVLFVVWAVDVAVHVPEAIPILLIPLALLLSAFPTIAVMAWLRLRSGPSLL